MKRVCVFLGSSGGNRDVYRSAAADLGRLLARRGLGLVYGGGSIGLMGILADAALEAGGEVVGVIPERLSAKEIAHYGLADLRIVGSMHERKALMADLSDAFLAIPGGFGTLDELCEILTWAQLGMHVKPCGLLNVEGFFDAFLLHLQRAVDDQFLRPQHRDLLLVDGDAGRLLDRMETFHPPTLQKWIDREST